MIDVSALNAGSRIVFGAIVELADSDSGEERKYQIVGDLEAYIKLGMIAISSPVARALIARDALRADAYGGLSFGPGARAILKGEQQLTIAMPPPRKRRSRRSDDGPADSVFEQLREARRKLAADAGVPPYVVFHDSTLREIAARQPRSVAELSEVQGVGAAKLERYGEAMLAALSTNG